MAKASRDVTPGTRRSWCGVMVKSMGSQPVDLCSVLGSPTSWFNLTLFVSLICTTVVIQYLTYKVGVRTR